VSYQTERNKRGREILAELGRRFPRLFGVEMWEAHRPLAVGVDAQLREQCPDIAEVDLRMALRCLVGRRMYQVSLAAPGAVRFNLDGSEQGRVSEQHALGAQAVIKEIDKRRLDRAASARADRLAPKSASDAKVETAAPANGCGLVVSTDPSPSPPQAPPATDAKGRLTLTGLRQAGAARKAAVAA
jgi:sRNA-binding protein